MKHNQAQPSLPFAAASALTAGCAAVGLGFLLSLPVTPNLAVVAIPAFAACFAALLVVTGERAIADTRDDMESRIVRDPQTGLMPAHMADRVLAGEFAAARRGRRLAVVLFSIDDFPRHAAVHGESAALRWRRAAARVLRQRTRGMNVSARCRRDGLFLTILADVPLEGACTFASRVRRDYLALLRPGEPQSFSAGVAEYDDSMSSPAELMGRAERALARARSEGGRVVMVGVTTGGAVRTVAELAPLPDRVEAAGQRVRHAEERFQQAEERVRDAEERARIAGDCVRDAEERARIAGDRILAEHSSGRQSHDDLSVPNWWEARLH